MTLPLTETLPDHQAIDAVPLEAGVHLLLDGQQAAILAVRHAAPKIARAVQLLAETIKHGGSLIYVAAGSSGLMALADGSELPGTFGIPAERIRIHMAGGIPVDGVMPGHTEDEGAAMDGLDVAHNDTVIVLSASGSTPYALAAAMKARKAGAKIIAIANNHGTPLLQGADVAICLATPPEVVAGSTRLGAGTAQKATLNAMSTLMGVALGHVYQGMMVNLVADNDKLRRRAALIVSRISDVTPETSAAALDTARGDVKSAILIAKGHSPQAAKDLLQHHGGHLGPCLTKTTLKTT